MSCLGFISNQRGAVFEKSFADKLMNILVGPQEEFWGLDGDANLVQDFD
jgi:hypothetical protein